MPLYLKVTPDTQALTANGTTTGLITIADIRNFHKGAIVYLKDNDTAPRKYKIGAIAYTTAPAGTLQLRAINDIPGVDNTTGAPILNAISYGFSDVSAYTTAQNAVVSIPKQIVEADPSYVKPGLKNYPY